jgi:NTP pyrophosphatase (non-canonical NTP hydrolase)
MADILIIVVTIANRLDVDLDEAVRSKQEINGGRESV